MRQAARLGQSAPDHGLATGVDPLFQLRTKNNQAAQVALDVLRSQGNRDSVFLALAEKNVLGAGKTLPLQLTPLSPTTLALLQMANLPLPAALYTRTDPRLTPALLRLTAQQDVAALALGERAVERALLPPDALAAVYRTTNFAPDALATPLTSSGSGLRLRALLFRAAEGERSEASASPMPSNSFNRRPRLR